jgi:hypothetical protein
MLCYSKLRDYLQREITRGCKQIGIPPPKGKIYVNCEYLKDLAIQLNTKEKILQYIHKNAFVNSNINEVINETRERPPQEETEEQQQEFEEEIEEPIEKRLPDSLKKKYKTFVSYSDTEEENDGPVSVPALRFSDDEESEEEEREEVEQKPPRKSIKSNASASAGVEHIKLKLPSLMLQ